MFVQCSRVQYIIIISREGVLRCISARGGEEEVDLGLNHIQPCTLNHSEYETSMRRRFYLSYVVLTKTQQPLSTYISHYNGLHSTISI